MANGGFLAAVLLLILLNHLGDGKLALLLFALMDVLLNHLGDGKQNNKHDH